MTDFKPKDGLVFVDPKDPEETAIFNYYTWTEMLKAIMVKYGKLSVEEANHIATTNEFVLTAADSYKDVIMTAHELEYHWAMLLAQGDGYWARGFSETLPEGYEEWDKEYRKQHNLAEFSIDFETNENRKVEPIPAPWEKDK